MTEVIVKIFPLPSISTILVYCDLICVRNSYLRTSNTWEVCILHNLRQIFCCISEMVRA